MAIVVTNIGTNTVTSATNTLTGVVAAAGSLLFLAVVDNDVNGISGTVSDSVNGAWTAGIPKKFGNAGFAQQVNYFYFPNSALLAAASITYTGNGGAGTATAISALSATGIATVAPLDTAVTAFSTPNNSAANPPFSLVSGVTTAAGELAIAFVGYQFGSAALTLDAGDGWVAVPTNINSGGNVIQLLGGHQTTAGAGSATTFAPVNAGASSILGAAYTLGFKAAGGGGAANHNLASMGCGA